MFKKLKTPYKFFLIILVCFFLFILIYNIFHYDPILGYDAEAHYAYVDAFSRYMPRAIHIPTEIESREFFSPPLTYIFPSFIQVICRNLADSNNLLEYCKPVYGKASQIFQNILYIISVFINILTLKKLTKKNSFNISFLLMLMMLAVNYRTISMIRGEAYILFFLSLLIYKFVSVEIKKFNYNYKDVLGFGFIIGCLALSRQWVFFIFLAFFVTYFKTKKYKKEYSKFVFSSFFVGFIFSGWFYFINLFRYGTFTAFNSEMNKNLTLGRLYEFISFDNVTNYIFTKPIRPHFENKFLPIFYSDTWGDYWGYFSFTSRFLDVGRNQLEIGSYLGVVNLLSVFTTSIIFYFYFKTMRRNENNIILYLLNYSVIISFVGYFLFVFLFQHGTQGDVTKATYLVQMINIMVFSASISFENMKKTKTYNLLIITLFFIFLYNFQSYLSHFPINYPN